MSADDTDHAHWFAREIHAHEPPLRAYLRGSFPWLTDVDDVVQDALLRLWTARNSDTIRSGRAFLFTTARNAAIDQHRRLRTAPADSVADIELLPVDADGPGVAETVSRNQELEILREAVDSLPDRCRTILILRKLQNMPQREIARRLAISENTVEAQVAKGMRRCAEYFRQRGLAPASPTHASRRV